MEYRNKISITGDLGSGKSRVGKLLSEQLAIPIISTGAIQRGIAERLGMTTLELNQYAETHREIDDEIDNKLRALHHSPDSCIIDSRLAWFFVPSSLKIYLQVDLDTAVSRIINDTSRRSEQYSDKETAKNNIIERKVSENKRYLALYGADCAAMENYDVVIDTTNFTPEQVAERIIQAFTAYKTH